MVKKKNFKFVKNKLFMDENVKLSHKIKKQTYIWTLLFDNSHIVLQ